MKASELIFIHAEGGVDAHMKCNACQKELPIGTPLRYADVVVSPDQTATVIVCSRTCQRFFVRNGDAWLDEFLTELQTNADIQKDISGPEAYALIQQAKANIESVEIMGTKLKLGNPLKQP